MRRASLVVAACALLTTAYAADPPAGNPAQDWGALRLLGREVAPGAKRKFSYQFAQTFEGAFLDTVVFAARGARPGPTLCLTALIHGDERNGFEVAREIVASTDAGALAGTLIALPAANIHGFRTGSRYMPDRRDLNRAFPGVEGSSNTALIASIIFSNLREHCDALIDLHTGSLERANLPQIRVDLAHGRAFDLARHFGAAVVIGGAGPRGSLRREMMEAGIPALVYEAGLPLRFEREEIARGVQGVRNVMIRLGMMAGEATAPTPDARIFSRSNWVRTPLGNSGIFYPRSVLDGTVRRGDVIAEVIDPFTDERFVITSPYEGHVVGIAVPQVVFSGYAILHVARN
ncbi:MAG: succinylglutamate desuccinylase/aspartoacylase family protein [Gammaproteobacteria bacterium]|nr:MAG: succinylglutamate desuccinylase/aspartoacylase family protein [Gammaproteobacteria bacterium]